MSNQTILKRLHVIVDQSEIEIGPSFESIVEWHMRALEGAGLQEIHHAWQLASDIRFAHFIEDGVEYGDPADAMKARVKLRSFIADLERRIGGL